MQNINSPQCAICHSVIEHGQPEGGCRGGKIDGPLIHIFHETCFENLKRSQATSPDGPLCPTCRSPLDGRISTETPKPAPPIAGRAVAVTTAADGRQYEQLAGHDAEQAVNNSLGSRFCDVCGKVIWAFAKFVAGLVVAGIGLGILFGAAKIAGFALAGTVALLAIYGLAILISTVVIRCISQNTSWSTAFVKGSGFLAVIALAMICEAEMGAQGGGVDIPVGGGGGALQNRVARRAS